MGGDSPRDLEPILDKGFGLAQIRQVDPVDDGNGLSALLAAALLAAPAAAVALTQNSFVCQEPIISAAAKIIRSLLWLQVTSLYGATP